MTSEPGTARQQAQLRSTPAPAPSHPLHQFARLMGARASPFRNQPLDGYKRGIDFYSAADLPRVLATAAAQFEKSHGRFPNLIQPQRYTDKIFWSKFFRQMKVPETGNKLLTASFIPDDLRESIQVPEIVWHSTRARVPRGDEVEPGTYYLKANLGSDRYARVTYPITDAEADALDSEFEAHLTRDYNWWRGEWWYHVFQRELLLERAIGAAEHSTSWNFLVIGGEIARIAVYQKLEGGTVRKTHLTPQFEPLPGDEASQAIYRLPSAQALERMCIAARGIGGPLRFVRVDFLLDEEERPYLGEVTFTPGNAVARLPEEMDMELGAVWNLRSEPV